MPGPARPSRLFYEYIYWGRVKLFVGREQETLGLVSELGAGVGGRGANCGIVWITFATDVSLLLFHMLAEGKAIPPQFGKTWKLLSRCCVPLALPNSLAFTLSPHPLNGSEVPHSHPYPKIFWQGQKSMHPSIHPSIHVRWQIWHKEYGVWGLLDWC